MGFKINFKTYYNNQINAVSLNEKDMKTDKLEIYELPKKQNIKYLNWKRFMGPLLKTQIY